jgi:acetylornithine deacetylase
VTTSQPVLNTLCDLIGINSVNPAYAHGVPEAAIQQFIYNFFEQAGIPVETQEVSPGRPNVIAKLRGRNPERRLIFEAHVDTAGIGNMTIPPFEPSVSDGKVWGRGACDTKGGLAAMMHAVLNIKRSGVLPDCDVWLAAAADEEHAYRGVLQLCEGLTATGAVVAEPTGLRMVVAHKGCLRWRVVVKGRAAHSSKPHLGVSAITPMAKLILTLDEEARTIETARHPLVGCPTLNVGMIHGGTQVNIVPDDCWIEIDRRLIPGEQIDDVEARYRRMAAELQKASPDTAVAYEPLLSDWPMETPVTSRIVESTASILENLGLNAEPVGVPFGSDASKLARVGIPSIVLGPGSIDQAHTADEWVEADAVVVAEKIYEHLIRNF